MSPGIAAASPREVAAFEARSRWRLALTVVLLVAAIAGTAVSGYLAWENAQGKSGVCTVVHGCSTVQQSKYGKVLGIPISIPGLALYVVLVAAAGLLLTNFRGWASYAILIAFFGSLFGLAFSAFLTYLEAFVIDAWCIYCIVSALLMVLLAIGWSAILAAEVRAQRRE